VRGGGVHTQLCSIFPAALSYRKWPCLFSDCPLNDQVGVPILEHGV
jgi:hypothetical protein